MCRVRGRPLLCLPADHSPDLSTPPLVLTCVCVVCGKLPHKGARLELVKNAEERRVSSLHTTALEGREKSALLSAVKASATC